MMTIINYEQLELPIQRVENILADYDKEEKKLILEHVTKRFNQRLQDSRIKENMDKALPKFVTKMIRKKEQEDEEDGN